MNLDYLLRNCRVIDGTGSPWFFADVGVENNQLVLLSPGDKVPRAKKEIDIKEKFIAPGFIDPHNHSELLLLKGKEHRAKILQGLTTEVIGSDGITFAPLKPNLKKEVLLFWSGIVGNVPEKMVQSENFSGYLKSYQGRIISNIVPLAGHAVLRLNVLGWENRKASREEIAKMVSLLEACLEGGAWGMSTGLTYPPCSYSDTEELIALAQVLSKYGRLYVPHERYTSGDKFLDPMRETIYIAEKSRCSVYVDHLFASGKYAPQVSKLLRLIDSAREKGIDITFNQHPYDAAATVLWATLPPWLMEDGPRAMLEKIDKPKLRDKIREEIEKRNKEQGVFDTNEWASIYIGGVKTEANKRYEGLSIEKASRESKKDVIDFVCDLLREEELAVNTVIRRGLESALSPIFSHHCQTVCSDGILWGDKVHPRGYGAFPKAIADYWKKKKLLPLEKVIQKMSGATANRLGIKNRGYIRNGYKADLVVLDPEQIEDKATYKHPLQYPSGIEYVFVNGHLIVKKGEIVGGLYGEVLRP
jgi:N-acyl-D-aspartate/D-glutamate deacylase